MKCDDEIGEAVLHLERLAEDDRVFFTSKTIRGIVDAMLCGADDETETTFTFVSELRDAVEHFHYLEDAPLRQACTSLFVVAWPLVVDITDDSLDEAIIDLKRADAVFRTGMAGPAGQLLLAGAESARMVRLRDKEFQT